MTTPDKLYALQLAFKECGVMLTAEEVRRVLGFAGDVAAVARTPMGEGSARATYVSKLASGIPAFPPVAWMLNANKLCSECGTAGFTVGCTTCIGLARSVNSIRWPAYGPGPGGQGDREGKG